MTSTSRLCPYCGNPYPTITIPSFRGPIERQSNTCGCQGEVDAARAEHIRAKRRNLVNAWARTGTPEKFRGVTPDYDGLGQLEFSGGLYLFGPKGTGKTTRATAIMKAWVSRNESDGYASARYVSVPDWLASMRKAWGIEEEDAFQVAAGCKLLLLDDIGKGKPTQWAMERLFRLIDNRYSRERTTIYTSQHRLEELGAACASEGDTETAEAIVSRIFETCTAMEFTGADLRTVQK